MQGSCLQSPGIKDVGRHAQTTNTLELTISMCSMGDAGLCPGLYPAWNRRSVLGKQRQKNGYEEENVTFAPTPPGSPSTSGAVGGRFGWLEAGVCEAGSGCDSGG